MSQLDLDHSFSGTLALNRDMVYIRRMKNRRLCLLCKSFSTGIAFSFLPYHLIGSWLQVGGSSSPPFTLVEFLQKIYDNIVISPYGLLVYPLKLQASTPSSYIESLLTYLEENSRTLNRVGNKSNFYSMSTKTNSRQLMGCLKVHPF